MCATPDLLAQRAPEWRPTVLPPPVLLGSEEEDRLRLAHLLDRASTSGYLIRSISSLEDPLAGQGVRWEVMAPSILYVQNSDLPYTQNDGSLWAGRGWNLRVTPGVRVEAGPVRLRFMPELVFAENAEYELWSPRITYPPPPHRHPLSSPWGVAPTSIDLPLRFGEEPYTGFFFGQSSLAVDAGVLQFGMASENQWWGPGIRNAILLSNNAPGFGHVFVRTARPFETRVGDFEGRWLVGILTESPFFDTLPTNDYNSISALALTWRPPGERGLTLGIARSVYSPTRGIGSALGDFYQVFSNVGRPNALPDSDSTQKPGRDQLVALFGRWVLAESRFESYFEWARYEQPASVRDLLVAPNHTRAYTVGLQWVSGEVGNGRFRVQGEITTADQSPTFRDRPIGSWYTSRAVIQGYTNHGQVLGAAIGPGGSSQWFSIDYVASTWRAGLLAARIRWNDDAWTRQEWPLGVGWCKHDVSLLPGGRAAFSGRFGTVTTEFTAGNRLNVFFKNFSNCPKGDDVVDVRNQTLFITFSPARVRP